MSGSSELCLAQVSQRKVNIRLAVICLANIFKLFDEGSERWTLFWLCGPTLLHYQRHLVINRMEL